MDDEDIQHWQHLIQEHKRYLRILEEKVAGYGKLQTPAQIMVIPHNAPVVREP